MKMTISKTIVVMMLLGCVIVLGGNLFAEGELKLSIIWLDEMDLTWAMAGFGDVQKNKSVEGHPLSIGGNHFERGIGTHADSRMDIKLNKTALCFEAVVGIDDEVSTTEENKKASSATFIVYGDGKELWRSGMMKAGHPTKAIKVDLKGVDVLRLFVSGGEDIICDHADWADARIQYEGEKPALITPVAVKPYILTPKPGPEPRITGPKVFGVRPGNPFLFTITATGEKPMTFEVLGLPEGLLLNAENGQITGAVKKEGEYKTTVVAQNKAGKAERDFKIVVGGTICLTPPMGWNSWNSWACAVDDAKVRASAKAMAESGLRDHGWMYINIDDCWMRKEDSNDPVIGKPARDKDGYLLANAKFPDMKALTDYVHSLGLKAGIYISPGPTTCQGYVGSWQFEQKDAERFAEWGLDYLKYDWCGYSKLSDGKKIEELRRPYALMREKLSGVPRDIVYSLCQYGMGEVWKWGAEIGGNCWRTTGDIRDTWGSMAGIGFKQAELYPYAGPGRWNDPDMLVAGKVGWGSALRPTRLTADEQYTHISLWCLLSAPLLVGCPLEQMDDFTYSLLTNDEVLEINQDSLGQQARRIAIVNDTEVWSKAIEDGSRAVGLFNLNELEIQKVTIQWKDIAFAGQCRVRDLWRQKDLGVFEGSFTADVPAHGVILIRIIPIEDKDGRK